ncbi:MAG: tellurite resistance protein, partial [Bacteroidetes bacterium]|nr:tellurite resistance protein [Bacteroidota bacterium]
MNDYSQDLQNVAQQAKAPVLAEVTEISGQGALTPVQAPSNLEPIQPKHLAVEDIQSFESEANDF